MLPSLPICHENSPLEQKVLETMRSPWCHSQLLEIFSLKNDFEMNCSQINLSIFGISKTWVVFQLFVLCSLVCFFLLLLFFFLVFVFCLFVYFIRNFSLYCSCFIPASMYILFLYLLVIGFITSVCVNQYYFINVSYCQVLLALRINLHVSAILTTPLTDICTTNKEEQEFASSSTQISDLHSQGQDRNTEQHTLTTVHFYNMSHLGE